MRMPATILEDPTCADVVLGPCPGCEAWQLDYTRAAAAELAAGWGMARFHSVVEDLLQEHLAECRHLQLILEQL